MNIGIRARVNDNSEEARKQVTENKNKNTARVAEEKKAKLAWRFSRLRCAGGGLYC